MNFMNAILRMEERKYEISFNLTFGLLNASFALLLRKLKSCRVNANILFDVYVYLRIHRVTRTIGGDEMMPHGDSTRDSGFRLFTN